MILPSLRCKGFGRTRPDCGALLACNVEGHVEIVCPKCHTLNVVDTKSQTHVLCASILVGLDKHPVQVT